MKNILKVIFLGVVGFALLVYLTMPDNVKQNKKIQYNGKTTLDSFPRFFDVVSKNEYTKFEEIFNSKKQYLIILNHDALAVFKDLYKYTDKNIVLVANISNTPWVVKKLAVDDKLIELYKDSNIPLINDNKGLISTILNIKDNTQNRYVVYEITQNKEIKELFSSTVRLNALEDGISSEEIQKELEKFLTSF